MYEFMWGYTPAYGDVLFSYGDWCVYECEEEDVGVYNEQYN